MTNANVDGITTELFEGLKRFQADVNAHPQMAKVLKKWDRLILIESLDSSDAYTLTVQESRIADLQPGRGSGEHDVQVRGSLDILLKCFCGNLSPARAHDDGLLQVLASDPDQIKLDAIALILWGL